MWVLLLLGERGALNRSCLVDQAKFTRFPAEYFLALSIARRLVLNFSGKRPRLEGGETTDRTAFLSPCFI